MTYKKLTEDLKKKLVSEVEKIEIEVTDLDSYHYDPNPYCVEEQLVGTSGCGTWSKTEEWQAQIQEAKKFIEEYGACEFMDLPDNAWDDKDSCDDKTITKECIYYLERLEE